MTDASGVVLGGLDRNVDKLSKVRNLMFAACGTSLYASQYGAKLMRDMGAVDTCNAQVSRRKMLVLRRRVSCFVFFHEFLVSNRPAIYKV